MNRWKFSFLACFALFIALLAGCSRNIEAELVGSWKVDSTFAASTTPTTDANAAALLSLVSLDLRQDKTFVYSMAIVTMEGTWEVNPDASGAALHVTKAAGQTMPAGQTITATLENSKLHLRSAAGGTNEMVFEKK